MSTNEFTTRGRNALIGLAIGDAIGWPAMYHRSHLLPPSTRRLRREIDAQREEVSVLRIPLPFSMNLPAEGFAPGPTDDTEWCAWTMMRLLRTNVLVTTEAVAHDWEALARQEQRVRGGISTHVALENLRKGILPPASGRENPHYFDDGAMCRALPIGLAYAGRPDGAIRAAEREAAATNAEDGVWVAAAVSAAVSVASVGASAMEMIGVAMRALPAGSWSRRVAEEGARIGTMDCSDLDLIHRLQGIGSVEYVDGCVGPETLAVVLAVVARAGGDYHRGVLIANAVPRSADAAPAIAAALCAALTPDPIAPPDWLTVEGFFRGISLPQLEGKKYMPIVDAYVASCAQRVPAKNSR